MKWSLACAAALILVVGGSGCAGGDGGAPGAGSVHGDQPSVSIAAVGPDEPVPGGGVGVATIVLSNGTGAAARAVVLTTLLGPGLVPTAVTCTAHGLAVCPHTAGTAIHIDTLPVRSALVFSLSIGVAAGSSGDISGTATAAVGGAQAPMLLETSFRVGTYSADLRVTGASPAGRVVESGPVGYTMTVSNAGPDGARNVLIASSVDAGQALGTLMCMASGGAACPAVLGPAMTVPFLPKDGVLTFDIAASVPATGADRTLTNIMSAQAAGDPRGADNVATVSVAATPRNAVNLESDADDYIGAGRRYAYDRSNSIMSVTAEGARLLVRLNGNEVWLGDFQLPGSSSQVEAGTYVNLERYPFHDPAIGGLSWYGNGRGCNTSRSNLSLTRAVYAGGQLDAATLSFEQYCERGTAALRGRVHWTSSDTSAPPGPVNPPPSDLWQPSPGAVPAAGNYVHLQSEPGDYILQGLTRTDTAVAVRAGDSQSDAHIMVTVAGQQGPAMGWFQGTGTQTRLQPGYYANLRRWPFHNPVTGGLSWIDGGRSCNSVIGWFAVDSIRYDQAGLAAIVLRFEQHCDGAVPALRGKIVWTR